MLLHADKEKAKKLFQTAASECPKRLIASWAAKIELNALGGNY